jgi:hypothetical protein
MEATLLLTLIVQRFRVELLAGERLDLKPAVTLRQKGRGLRVRITRREPEPTEPRPRELSAVFAS